MATRLFLVVYILSGLYHLSKESEQEYACVDHIYHHCSTLTISCDEGELIQINKRGILHAMINTSRPDGNCSNNVTVCKTFIDGCCASDGYSDIEPVSRNDSQLVRDSCDGKRNCSFVLSKLKSLERKEFLMVEYICVKDDMIDICGYDTGTVLTSQNRSKITYSNSHEMTEDSRRSCHCDVSSRPEVNMAVYLVDVKLGSKEKNCTPARLKISDNMDLVRGEISNLTFKVVEPFAVDLDVYFDNPPESIWIEIQAPDGTVTVNCSSRTYALETNTGKAINTRNLNSTECQRLEEEFATIIAVPVAVVVLFIAVIIIVLAVRYRLRKNSTKEFRALDRASGYTQRQPSYYTVEPHALEDGRISALSETNVGVNHQGTAAALKQNLPPKNITTDIELDKLTVPKVSYYERISMSDIQSETNMEHVPTVSGVSEQGEMTKDRQSVHVVNMVKEEKKKGGVSPAAYDKLTFTLPPACKLPHYHTADPVFVPDDNGADDLENHTADQTIVADNGKSQTVNLATAEGGKIHTTDQTGVAHDGKNASDTADLTIAENRNSDNAYLNFVIADGGFSGTVNHASVANEGNTINAEPAAADNVAESTAADGMRNHSADLTAADRDKCHLAGSTVADEMPNHTENSTVVDDRNSGTSSKTLVADIL